MTARAISIRLAESVSGVAARLPATERVRPRARVPRLVRDEPFLFALAGLAALAYTLYSVSEHNHFMTDFDLAIADQAVWHYAHLESPTITTIGEPVSMLGDHFSPILIALAPLYWIWSDPRMLLIAQALLIAASIVPVFLFARPRVGRLGAYLLSAAYACFWGISAAVGYNFHELAFAPLFIALCILFADRRQWTGFFVSLGLLLLVKENMSVLAVFIGLWLITGREFRRGAITVAIGLAWYFLAINVFLPEFAGHAYTHWTYQDFGSDAPSAVGNIVAHPDLPIRELFDEPEKRHVLAYLFLPFLGLVLCSRLGLLLIPLVAQQLFSSYEPQWSTDFHYWLPVAPILAMGAADGLRNLMRWIGRRDSIVLARAGFAVAAVILGANLFLAERFPLWDMARAGFSVSASPSEADSQHVVAAIPGDASATVSAPLLPHLSQRRELHLLGRPAPSTEYVVFSPGSTIWPDPDYEHRWLEQHRSLYRESYKEGQWIVWRLRSESPAQSPRPSARS